MSYALEGLDVYYKLLGETLSYALPSHNCIQLHHICHPTLVTPGYSQEAVQSCATDEGVFMPLLIVSRRIMKRISFNEYKSTAANIPTVKINV